MKRILIVDDHPHVIRVLKLSLEREGYCVESACDGNDAIARIRLASPDVMITDLCMPGMGGQALCQAIQTELPERRFLILIMTSMTAKDERDWTSKFANLEFLEKPLSPRRLCTRLAEYFSETRIAAHA